MGAITSNASPSLFQIMIDNSSADSGKHVEMKVYHATTLENAQSILVDGFKDCTGTYLTGIEWTGVWFANRPMDESDISHNDVAHVIEAWFEFTIDEDLIAGYEWVNDGSPHREWQVPATVINTQGKIRQISEDEAGDINSEFFMNIVT